MMRRIERENTGLLHAGQDLVVAGYAGLAGTVKLAEAEKEKLSRWFSNEYMEEIAGCSRYLCGKPREMGGRLRCLEHRQHYRTQRILQRMRRFAR